MNDYTPDDLEKLARRQSISPQAFRAILADPQAAAKVIQAGELFSSSDEDVDLAALPNMPVSFQELADFVESPRRNSPADRFLAEQFPEARSRVWDDARQDDSILDEIRRLKDSLMSLIEQHIAPFRMLVLVPALVLLLITSITSGWIAYKSNERVAALQASIVDIGATQQQMISLLVQREALAASAASASEPKPQIVDVRFPGAEGEPGYRQKVVVGSDRLFVVAQRNANDQFFDTKLKFDYEADRTKKAGFGEILAMQVVNGGADAILGGGVYDTVGRLRLLHLDSGEFGDLDLSFPNMVTSIAAHQDHAAWVVKSDVGAQLYFGKVSELSSKTPVLDELDSVARVAFSNDGTRMAVASEHGTVRVWDITDASQPRMIMDRTVVEGEAATSDDRPISYSIAFSSDGQSLMVGTGQWVPWGAKRNEGKVFVIDLNTKQTTRVIEAHEGPVFAIAVGPAGETVTTAGADGAIKLWDLKTGDCLQSAPSDPAGVHGHSGVVQCLRYSPDGKFIATGGWDNTVRVFNAETFEQVALLTKHEFFVQAVGFTTDGGQLFSSGADDTVRFWKVTHLDGA